MAGFKRKNAVTTPASDELREHLDPSADAVGFFLGDLEIVIHKAEQAEIDDGE